VRTRGAYGQVREGAGLAEVTESRVSHAGVLALVEDSSEANTLVRKNLHKRSREKAKLARANIDANPPTVLGLPLREERGVRKPRE
jgi:hypothetical protein